MRCLAGGIHPDPLGEVERSPDPLAVIRRRGGRKRGDRVGKGEGGLDLDICPGAGRKFLVTPVSVATHGD